MINGGIATIYVSDLDRSVRFYTQTLGFKLRFRAGGDWAEVDAGNGLVLGLHGTPPGEQRYGKSGSITVGFNATEPLDQVVASLKQRGVQFRGPISGDAVRLAFFGDPDGNDLYLWEPQTSIE
jgi:catechol 2,3-dioxygenase-like lactoylglutathione lyase family enzyme